MLNGARLSIGKCISGVPQGSVIAPILFLLYINDLPDNLICDVYLFADDTKVTREVVTHEDFVILQADLLSLERRSDKWLLAFQPRKCNLLTLGYTWNR